MKRIVDFREACCQGEMCCCNCGDDRIPSWDCEGNGSLWEGIYFWRGVFVREMKGNIER